MLFNLCINAPTSGLESTNTTSSKDGVNWTHQPWVRQIIPQNVCGDLYQHTLVSCLSGAEVMPFNKMPRLGNHSS